MHMLIKKEKDVLIFSLEKEVVQEDVDVLQKKLLETLDEGGLKVVLDMSKCNYITSMGLSAIFHVKRKFNEKGGDIRIACINTLIKNLFSLTNLNKTISIYDSLEDATKEF
jgi:anti-sigma B factor antagonist